MLIIRNLKVILKNLGHICDDSDHLFLTLLLSFLFQKLFRGFPVSKPLLTSYRENLASFQRTRWDASWNKIVLPLLKER